MAIQLVWLAACSSQMGGKEGHPCLGTERKLLYPRLRTEGVEKNNNNNNNRGCRMGCLPAQKGQL